MPTTIHAADDTDIIISSNLSVEDKNSLIWLIDQSYEVQKRNISILKLEDNNRKSVLTELKNINILKNNNYNTSLYNKFDYKLQSKTNSNNPDIITYGKVNTGNKTKSSTSSFSISSLKNKLKLSKTNKS